MAIAGTTFSFQFRVGNATKPIVSAAGLFQAGLSTVMSKTGECYNATPSGQTVTLHRRQRACWLKVSISTGGELAVLTIGAVRENPDVQGLFVVGQDPGDEPAINLLGKCQNCSQNNTNTTVTED